MTKLRVILIALLAGCASDRAGIAGDATYADATTTPAGQTASVMVIMSGTGSIPYPDPDCASDTPGAWQAIYMTDANVADDGAYDGSLVWSELTTPTGCKLTQLSEAIATGIDVHAEIPSSVDNCQVFCATSAGLAGCLTRCTTESRAIAADVSIGTGGIGKLDASLLRESAFGSLSASLMFDHLQQ